jgi:hypothetical protein
MIASQVIVRDEKAEEILEKCLKVKEYALEKRNFGYDGSFASASTSTSTWASSTTRAPASTAWTSTCTSRVEHSSRS